MYIRKKFKFHFIMYWTFELISYLSDAPFPATKSEIIDYAMRIGAPLELIENLEQLDDDGVYHNIDEICPDRPTESEYYFNEDEYDY